MRLVNRVLATLLAAALVAGGLLLVVEVVIGYYLDRDPWLLPRDRWYADARDTAWSEQAVVFTFIVIGLAGLVLLALQLARRRPPTLALTPTSDHVHTDVSRRSLEHALTRATERVDGVAGAKARIRRNRAVVRATTERRLPGDLKDRVKREADLVLDQLGVAHRPMVDVAVTSRRPPERNR